MNNHGLLCLILFACILVSLGLAGRWDYQDSITHPDCTTDIDCQQKYGGEGYGGF